MPAMRRVPPKSCTSHPSTTSARYAAPVRATVAIPFVFSLTSPVITNNNRHNHNRNHNRHRPRHLPRCPEASPPTRRSISFRSSSRPPSCVALSPLSMLSPIRPPSPSTMSPSPPSRPRQVLRHRRRLVFAFPALPIGLRKHRHRLYLRGFAIYANRKPNHPTRC